jgi:hypothetical protein
MSKNGARVEGQLELGIKDLLPVAVLSALDAGVQDEKISIPFSDLWTFYRDAQEAKKTPRPAALKSGMKTRKRKRTSEEEMDEERKGAVSS